MRAIIIFILCLCWIESSPQPILEIKSHLQQKNFQSFKLYIDSVIDKADQKVSRIYWALQRRIVDNILEGSIVISILKDFDGVSNFNNYSIRLLTDGDKIFFYDFAVAVYKKLGTDEIKSEEVAIDSFKDEEGYNNFLIAYQKAYNAQVDGNDLFKPDVEYGWSCGITGAMPENAEAVTRFIKNGRIDSIKLWMRSADAGKQLYAIKGLEILSRGSYSLSEEDKKIISLVRNKDILVMVCDGCLSDRKAIREVIDEMNFRKRNNWIVAGSTVAISLIVAGIILKRRRTRKSSSISPGDKL